MRTAAYRVPAKGRFPAAEAEVRPKDRAAYQEDCPECGEPAGFRCVYTTGPDSEISAYGRPRDYLHPGRLRLRGSMTVRPHCKRSDLAAEKARRRAARAAGQARQADPVLRRRSDLTEVRAALAAFDLAEYEALRDWLREHGPVLWSGVRPDGTLRGDSYAAG